MSIKGKILNINHVQKNLFLIFESFGLSQESLAFRLMSLSLLRLLTNTVHD